MYILRIRVCVQYTRVRPCFSTNPLITYSPPFLPASQTSDPINWQFKRRFLRDNRFPSPPNDPYPMKTRTYASCFRAESESGVLRRKSFLGVSLKMRRFVKKKKKIRGIFFTNVTNILVVYSSVGGEITHRYSERDEWKNQKKTVKTNNRNWFTSRLFE